MSIRFQCQSCQARIKTPDGTEGKWVKCPRCGFSQPVPTVAKSASGETAMASGGDTVGLSALSASGVLPANEPVSVETKADSSFTPPVYRKLPVPQPHPHPPKSPGSSSMDTPASNASSNIAALTQGQESTNTTTPARTPPVGLSPAAPPPLPAPPPFTALLLLTWFFRILALASTGLAAHYVAAALRLNKSRPELAKITIAGLVAVSALWLAGELAHAVRHVARRRWEP